MDFAYRPRWPLAASLMKPQGLLRKQVATSQNSRGTPWPRARVYQLSEHQFKSYLARTCVKMATWAPLKKRPFVAAQLAQLRRKKVACELPHGTGQTSRDAVLVAAAATEKQKPG